MSQITISFLVYYLSSNLHHSRTKRGLFEDTATSLFGPQILLSKLWFLLSQVSLVSASIPSASLQALQDLHTATNGPNWVYPTGENIWNFTQENADPCAESWSGIACDQSAATCSTTTCDIIEISLSKYALEGQLPSSLIELTKLNYLKVEKNSLSGIIPWELFYTLTSISYLYLNENNFQGSLPNDINRLAHVNLLKLRENNLVGSIPDSFGEITNLGNHCNHDPALSLRRGLYLRN